MSKLRFVTGTKLEGELFNLMVHSTISQYIDFDTGLTDIELKKTNLMVIINDLNKLKNYFDKAVEIQAPTVFIHLTKGENGFENSRIKYMPFDEMTKLGKIIKDFYPKNMQNQAYIQINPVIVALTRKSPVPLYQKQTASFEKACEINETIKNVNPFHNYFIKNADFNTFYEFCWDYYLNSKNEKIQPLITDFTIQRAKTLGVTQATINQVQRITDDIIQRMSSKNVKVVQPLHKLYSKEMFIAEHSLMSAYLMTSVLNKNSGISPTSQIVKCVFAVLFHDIFLNKEFYDLELENHEDPLFKEHINKVVDLFNTLNLLDSDVEKILLYHHEKPDGSGPLKIQSLPYLSLVFNICHEFSCMVYNHGLFQNQKIINELKNTYKDNQSIKILKILEDTLIKGEES